MSEKETSQKVVTKYDRKVQRRKEEELRAQKEKRIGRIVGILVLAAIVIGLALIPIRKYIATNSTYITVGGHDITKVEFDYYYNIAKNDYIETYGSYMSYLGLNLSGDLSTQKYSDTMTWQDYFEQLAVDTIKQNKALLDEASAAGFTYDTAVDYAKFEESLKASAVEAGESIGRYYKVMFGEYATASRIRPYVEEGYLAAAYYSEVADSKTATEEEIQAYYEANTAEFDSVDFLLTEIAAEIPEAETVTDENGNETTVEPTEEEIQAAMAAAKEKADAALLVIEEEGEAKDCIAKSSISVKYNEWLFDDARKEGDTTIVEDTDAHKYYVVMFKNRYLDNRATANVRTILTTTGDSEAILAEWQEAGGTEEAFISMVEKYSEDTYTKENGGLYEELAQSSIESDLSKWIFEEGRKAGDTTVITKDAYTYILYYVSDGRPAWQARIASTLLSESMNEYLTTLRDNCEVSDPKGHLAYLKAEAMLEETSTESVPEETGTEAVQ